MRRHYRICNCHACGFWGEVPTTFVTYVHLPEGCEDLDWTHRPAPPEVGFFTYASAAHYLTDYGRCPHCGSYSASFSCYYTDDVPWDEASRTACEYFKRDLLAQLVAEWELLQLHPRLAVGFHTEGLVA